MLKVEGSAVSDVVLMRHLVDVHATLPGPAGPVPFAEHASTSRICIAALYRKGTGVVHIKIDTQAEAAAVRAAAAGNQSGGDQMPFLAFIFANTAVGRP